MLEVAEVTVDRPIPRLPSTEPGKPFAVYEEGTKQVPDLQIREPIGDYSELPDELADLPDDPTGLSRVDDFVTRYDGPPSPALTHALSMYLCDYLVVTMASRGSSVPAARRC